MNRTPGIDVAEGSELLIREARRRQHRRFAATLVAVAATGGLVAGLVYGVGGTGRNVSPGSAGSPIPKVTAIRSVTFRGPFVPLQVVSAAGKAWVEGTNTENFRDGCSLEEIDPATLHRMGSFPLPACGTYITTGGGLIYLAGDLPQAGVAGEDQFRLEIFDPVTRQARLLSPVITTTMGSSRAHMDMTYQNGWIWMSEWGSSLWKISPSTGHSVLSIHNGPPSSGGHGIIVGNKGGLWITPGAGSGSAIYRIAPGSTTLSTIYTGPKNTSVLWLATIANKVWASVTHNAASTEGVNTSLKVFNLDGTQTLSTGDQQFGDVPAVGNTTQAWSVGSGPRCANPQRLWFLDPATGKSASVATLATPIEPCLTEDPTSSQIALVKDTVLILEPTGTDTPPAVLHAVQTGGR